MSLFDQKYYSIEELAELLGVTTRTIRNYLKDGKINGFKIGGRWKFSRDNIEEYIYNHKNEILNIDKLQNQGIDTCKTTFNFHIDFDKQKEFFQRSTKAYNEYEERNTKDINCYLTCLSLNNMVVEVTIIGEIQHVLNLASNINKIRLEIE